jgi:hypothetical protein
MYSGCRSIQASIAVRRRTPRSQPRYSSDNYIMLVAPVAAAVHPPPPEAEQPYPTTASHSPAKSASSSRSIALGRQNASPQRHDRSSLDPPALRRMQHDLAPATVNRRRNVPTVEHPAALDPTTLRIPRNHRKCSNTRHLRHDRPPSSAHRSSSPGLMSHKLFSNTCRARSASRIWKSTKACRRASSKVRCRCPAARFFIAQPHFFPGVKDVRGTRFGLAEPHRLIRRQRAVPQRHGQRPQPRPPCTVRSHTDAGRWACSYHTEISFA